jgi:hypothetical protein
MNIRIHYSIAVVALPLMGMALAATLADHRDVVVRIDAAKGIALIRDAHSGRVMAFKPSAADLAKLKVGDEVKANWKTGSLMEIKGIANTAALIQPDYGAPCCGVVAVVKDRATVQALLGGILSNVDANPAEPVGKADPINELRSKIKGIDAVKGIQADFGSLLDPAEPVGKPTVHSADPINGIVLVRDNTTGAFHMLNLSVLPETGTGQVSAPITSSVKIGDPVSIDPATGIATLKTDTGLYAFNLRGIKKTAEPVGATKVPWVVEPDPKAEGRFGLIRTNWHEKTTNGFWNLYVFLPGKRDADEYHSFQQKENSVMEGEYDLRINGMFLENVPVKAGHATRILLGALHYTAPFANQLIILDSKDRRVNGIQGGTIIALPIGTYNLKVGTRMIKIEIKENEVTDF